MWHAFYEQIAFPCQLMAESNATPLISFDWTLYVSFLMVECSHKIDYADRDYVDSLTRKTCLPRYVGYLYRKKAIFVVVLYLQYANGFCFSYGTSEKYGGTFSN